MIVNIFMVLVCIAAAVYVYFDKKNDPLNTLQDDLADKVKQVVVDLMQTADIANQKAINEIRDSVSLADTVDRLQKELARLKNEKSSIEETFNRKEREIEHKLGLERQRQEQELRLSIREAELRVQETNLKNERELFKKQIDATEKRFSEQLNDQNKLISNLIQALPNMQIIKTIQE